MNDWPFSLLQQLETYNQGTLPDVAAWRGSVRRKCGGPGRQKAPRSTGLDVGKSTRPRQHSRTNGHWNVMAVLRAPGELYLQYNKHIADPEKYGQVELIDETSPETVRRSPRLPTGGHTWCAVLAAHENGYLYLTNGNRCFKLDPDCAVVAETLLPQAVTEVPRSRQKWSGTRWADVRRRLGDRPRRATNPEGRQHGNPCQATGPGDR